MSRCQHAQTRGIGTRCYTGSVAVPPYTAENRAAHGNICVTEECRACGSRRDVLINGRHTEDGPWGPTRKAPTAAQIDRNGVPIDRSRGVR